MTGKATYPRKKYRRAALLGPVIALSLAISGQCLCPAFAAAPPQQPQVQIAFSKDAYWYEPGGTVQLKVTLDNKSGEAQKDVSVRAKVHTANTSRSDLDACLEGKPRKSYRVTETLGSNLTLNPGINSFSFQLPVPARFSDGVYPLTVEALREGSTLSGGITEIIVMSTKGSAAKPKSFNPLKLTVLFDMLEPPHRDPEGIFKNNQLAEECNPDVRKPGWYVSVLEETAKSANMHFTYSPSPVILEEMQDMSNGYVVRRGGKDVKFPANSAGALHAAAMLDNLKQIAQSPKSQFVPTPYASPDLEKLVALKWYDDARQQLSRGKKKLEEALDTVIGKDYFYPPALALNSRILRRIGNDIGHFLLLGPQLLERSREGKRIVKGMTLGSPVPIRGETGHQVLALFADGRLEKLIKRISTSEDGQGIAQCILSELTNLYFERPDKQRACVMVWPSWWHPSRGVLGEVLRAMSSAPWLQGLTLGESIITVNPIDNELEIPEPEVPTGFYFNQVARARDSLRNYSEVVYHDNPRLDILNKDVYISESDVWRQWNDEKNGLLFAGYVVGSIEEEFKKVDMPSVGSINLTSKNAKIPITVVNGTGYRMKAVLKFSSNGLAFPKGDELKVALEPKENLFEIPVTVKKNGRVRFTARLEAQNLVLRQIDTTIMTSRFNTFAIVVVGVLLALIGAIWIARVLARRKVGKHKKGQLKKTTEESEQGEEA